MPKKPPSRLSVVASIRNCVSTSRRLAPTALRSPISRVRSVTLTSMIFIMPMPPTSSEIAAIAPRNTVIEPVIVLNDDTRSSWVTTVKLLS